MAILPTHLPSVRPRLTVPRYGSWQDALKDAVRDAAELCRLLKLPVDTDVAGAAAGFPLLVPRGYVARMRQGDLDDPLLRQVLPRGDELAEVAGFTADPVADTAAVRQPGLLQKYAGRVLLIATGVCAVHCRYCFRRHYPYNASPHSPAAWQPAVDQIAADTSTHEVILSGGDPLALVDGLLGDLVDQLAPIPHVRRLRIHTRLPIVIPERVTDSLVTMLADGRFVPIVVVHANHANELDDSVEAALARLADAGVLLLNQAVLLRKVNDSVEAQLALCERLVDLHVLPYYLHQLDRVAGAAHFEVPPSVGRTIIDQLRARLPGYAVPRYVQEVPGAASKTSMA